MSSEDETILETWFNIKKISPGAQKTYMFAIKEFSELIGKGPSDLIADADAEENKRIKPNNKKAFKYLTKFKKKLENDGKAPSTIKLYLYGIKSFYNAFDIILPLPEIKLIQDTVPKKSCGKDITNKDIKKLINVSSTRLKAIICLMALSGIAQQEVRDLTIQTYLNSASAAINIQLDDVYDLIEHESVILQEVLPVEITRKNLNYTYCTFIPPETSFEIINFIKERCYGSNKKIRIKDNTDYIIVNNNGEKMSSDLIGINLRRMGQKARFKKDSGLSFWRSQSLRDYFIHTFIKKIGNKTVADYLAGYKISEGDLKYCRVDPKSLKKHYLKALPVLSFDLPKVRNEVSEKNVKINRKPREIKKNTKSLERKMSFKELLYEKEKELDELERNKLKNYLGLKK